METVRKLIALGVGEEDTTVELGEDAYLLMFDNGPKLRRVRVEKFYMTSANHHLGIHLEAEGLKDTLRCYVAGENAGMSLALLLFLAANDKLHERIIAGLEERGRVDAAKLYGRLVEWASG